MAAEASALAMQHLVSIDQVDASTGARIFDLADEMGAGIHAPETRTRLAGAVVALLFFEASSRTVLSFSAAAARLGAAVVTHQTAEASSLAKGESIEDTIRVVSSYVDAIVLRHPESGIAARAARASSVPLINGGDGGNEHPTQALIDLYTIHKNLHQLHGLRIAMGFDPLHSRAIRSLCRGLSHYPNNRVTLVGPPDLWMPDEDLDDLRSRGLDLAQTDDPDALLDQDIAYVNRFQSERIAAMKDPEGLRNRYRLTTADVARSSLKLILDPLPRVHELEEGIDALPQAAYFEQVRSGVPVRMALLSMFASHSDIGVVRPWIAATGAR
jgi:aspartate carbamoyltransferase catalytic subunit